MILTVSDRHFLVPSVLVTGLGSILHRPGMVGACSMQGFIMSAFKYQRT